MLTELQKAILEYARRESFHATIKDFIDCTGISDEDALNALKELRRGRIVALGPDIMNSWIGVTNHGWNLMGWR